MKILIADRQPVYRDGLKHNLQKINSSALVLDASSLEQINNILRQYNDLDLILADMDIIQPDWEQKVSDLLNRGNNPHIGIMAEKNNGKDAQRALNMGLSCYLPKNIESEVLKQALTSVLQGATYYPDNFDNNEKFSDTSAKKLTNRQFEVLEYLAQGLSNKQIAYQMNVSEATVKLHINALLRVIQATNRTQAVVKSQKLGLI